MTRAQPQVGESGRNLRSRALVLRRHPYGETSLVCDVLTADHGRVSVLARGAYRPNSRFYCVLDWFHRLELSWTERSEGALALARAGDVDRSRRAIPTDLARYRIAHRGLELVERATRPGEASARRFARTDAFLEALDAGTHEPALELARFDLWMLTDLGLAPALDRCASCGRAAPRSGQGPATSAFSAAAGGRLCPACAVEVRKAGQRVGTLSAALLDGAAALASGATAGASGQDLSGFLDRFLTYHLESELKSRGQQARIGARQRG